MKPIRVVLVDDHTLVRAGLRSLVQEAGGALVVGEADSAEDAFEKVSTHRPDVVVMDLAMAGMNGLEATRQLLKAFPSLRILILSMHSNAEYVRSAFQAGAAGYLLKRAAGKDLADAIKQVAAGHRYVNSAVKPAQAASPRPESTLLAQLTPRQRQILRLIAESRTTKEIASMLRVSAKTVEFHRAQLMERLQIFDVPALVRFALRVGLVVPEPPGP